MNQQVAPPLPVVIPRPQDITRFDLKLAVMLWQAHIPAEWAQSLELYQTLGQRLLKLGEPLIAYDVSSEGLQHWPADVLLRQQQAIALLRSGAVQRAEAIIQQLYRDGHRDEETMGILARTYKDRALRAEDPRVRQEQLQLAYSFYREAYVLTRGYWTGINAATMALLIGRAREAAALAREVRALCRRELARIEGTDADQYWLLATLGEAALLLRQQSVAERYYRRAVEYARRIGKNRPSYGELASARRNARLIIEHQGGDKEWIAHLLKIPRVAVFAGHMIDQPSRAQARFPQECTPQVRAAIQKRLVALDVRFGYASAASGSDILFLESLLELGGEAHIILPFNKQQFLQTSVEISPVGDWGRRCERVLEAATEVLIASEQQMHAEGMSYEYTNLLLQGLATIKAAQLETEVVGLAVWDGRKGDGPGGTASAIEHWRESKIKTTVIELPPLVRQQLGASPGPADRPAHGRIKPSRRQPELTPQIRAMLFADAFHFSQLREHQIPAFYRHFMGSIGELIRRTPYAPTMKKTWGDGLYFVFPGVREAGLFAIELCDLVNQTKWDAHALPGDLSLRIGLHAGPIYFCLDPITRQRTYVGSHVTRTARIEPVTPPGLVYTSQSFAALAAAQCIREFTCEYVGRIPLYKGYGTFPAYLLRRSQPKASRRSGKV